jgi:probable DNA repair protein
LDAGCTVLAPSAELARALFDAVERAHRDAGERVWPTPRVRDFTAWLREQHALRADADSRCLSDHEERELWRTAVEQSSYADRFVDPQGAARAAQRARRVMADYGIPAAALASAGGDEALALAEWLGRFETRCRELGCLSVDALQETFTSATTGLAWIESPGWRPAARRWLERHAGAPLAAPAAGRPTPPVILDAESPAAELAALADWARRGVLGAPGFRAWICVPDLTARRSELRDAFDAALAPERFRLGDGVGVGVGVDVGVGGGGGAGGSSPAYALAGGTPLADHGPVRAALDLLRLASGLVSFERFSACLRSPDYAAAPGDSSRAAALDVALRRDAPSELHCAEWLRRAERIAREHVLELPPVVPQLGAALAVLASARGGHLMSHWVPLWLQAFAAGPWVQSARWSSAEYQAATRLRELLTDLAAADRVYGTRTRHAAERILAMAARDTPFQQQTGIPPIWVSGELTDPWLNYDALWVTGLSEDVWPPPVQAVPLLPLSLQREFAVPTASAAAQLRTAQDLTRRWAVRAPRWVASFAKPTTARRSAVSPLLTSIARPAAAAGAPELEPALMPALMPALDAADPEPHWRYALRGAPILESLVDECGPPFQPGEHTHGTRSLSAQSQCAFRGFAVTRLASDTLRRPTPGFSNEQRGELVHAALEFVWTELRDSARLLASTQPERTALIERGIDMALARVCAQRDPGERWRARERLRLGTLLARWLEVEALRAPFSVERLEPTRDLARYAGLEFRCRVDRVDRLEDGARVVIDYKSGTPTYDWRGERPENLQLPVYALLYQDGLVAAAYGKVNARDCGFIAEVARDGVFVPGRKATKLEGAAGFPELLAIWSRRVESVAAALAAGRAEVAPTALACRRCDLHGFCRIADGQR